MTTKPSAKSLTLTKGDSIPLLLALLLWLVFVFIAWRGLDFGYHWDEVYTQVSVQKSIESGILVPTFYFYPGVCYDLGLAALVPRAWSELSRQDTLWTTVESQASGRSRFDIVQARLQSYVDSEDYLIKYRALTSLVSSLVVLVMFGIGWLMTGSSWAGLTVAALASVSSEFMYHSRWGVSDAMMAAMAALTMLLSIAALRYPDKRGWIIWASISAGITMATKYPGAIVLVMVWIAIAFREEGLRATIWNIVKSTGAALSTFLVLSPGTVLNPLRLLDSLQYIKNDYATGHPGHTIEPGLLHWAAAGEYLFTSLTSSSLLLSLLISASAIAGIIVLARSEKRLLLLITVPIAAYVLYMGTQRVFFVRNYLVLMPVWLTLAAAGFRAIQQLPLRYSFLSRTVFVLALVAVGVNIVGEYQRSESIVLRKDERSLRLPHLLEFLSQTEAKTFLSPRIQEEIRIRGQATPPTVVKDFNVAAQVALYASDIPAPLSRWHGESRNLTIAVFGPSEVNFNYYPMWGGEDRIVLLSSEEARQVGASFELEQFGPWPLFEK